MSKGEEERGREKGRVNGNIALFWKKMGINNGQSMFHLNLWVHVMWYWQECIFYVFEVESSINIY